MKTRKRKHRILLVDDHPVLRAGVKSLISSQPDMTVVGEASDGVEAVHKTKKLRPDLVVMDISMPRCDGLRATETIKKINPMIRVIVLTVYEDSEFVRQVCAAGASAYILKRSITKILLQAIRTVMEGVDYMDPEISSIFLNDFSTWANPLNKEELSAREVEVLRHLAWGKTNKETSECMDVSPKTVETYRIRLMRKLGLKTREGLVRHAARRGWLREG